MDAESVDVTAGLGGFLAFFLLALALYFLMRNMNARMRRMAYREELAAKQTHDGAPDGPDGPDGPDRPDASDDPDDPGTDRPESPGPQSGPAGGPALG